MLILGDVLAIVSIFFVGGLTLWGCLVACGLLCVDRVELARSKIALRPGRSFLIGLLLAATLGVLSIALSAAPAPPLKLLGFAMMLALVCISFVGSSGLARIAGDRIGSQAPDLPGYAQLSRGAGYVVLPALLPLIGWFFVGPIILLMGLGAGWGALFARSERVAFEA